jgi:hypothetical protein
MREGGYIYNIVNAPVFAGACLLLCIILVIWLGMGTFPHRLPYMVFFSTVAFLFMGFFCRSVCGERAIQAKYSVLNDTDDERFLL